MKATRGVILGRWGIALAGLVTYVGSAAADPGSDLPQMSVDTFGALMHASYLMLGAFF